MSPAAVFCEGKNDGLLQILNLIFNEQLKPSKRDTKWSELLDYS